MTPLVSICVPIYNVAPYIQRCVKSLMEQDYANIEYIFVNDCSTDNSVELLNNLLADYPEREAMVHLYHNDRNHGLAYTRRKTIENASGEYITCVDSDDWIEPNYISSLVTEALRSHSDIVDAPYIERSQKKEVYYTAYHPTSNIFEDCLNDLICHLCCKLIRRNLFVQYQCYAPTGMNYLEDRIILLQLCHYTHRVSSINNSVYHYERQGNSISFTKSSFHFHCLVQFWTEAERLMQEWGIWQQYQTTCLRQQIEDKTCLMLRCSPDTRKEFADLFRQHECPYIHTLSWGLKIMAILVHLHWWKAANLYQKYINWKDNKQK